jgi:hypothetical protein
MNFILYYIVFSQSGGVKYCLTPDGQKKGKTLFKILTKILSNLEVNRFNAIAVMVFPQFDHLLKI